MPAADRADSCLDIDGLFSRFAECERIALAVSGGLDSLALMVLVRQWRAARDSGPQILVMTVDHGLRAQSAVEAEQVGRIAAAYEFAYLCLRWDGEKPATAIEEAARKARYRLLVEACRAHGVDDLLVAHHREDQAETVLMRLGRGSGVTGLGGMRSERLLADGVRLHRPLLRLPRKALEGIVANAGLTPVEDESNTDRRFVRPQLRHLAPALAKAGITASGIAKAAERLTQADAGLDYAVERFLADAVIVDDLAVVRLDRTSFMAAPREIRQRALARIVAVSGGRSWPAPRYDRLEAAEAALAAGHDAKRTLGGATLVARREEVVIFREAGRIAAAKLSLSAGCEGVWDGRFAYSAGDGATALTLGPLGEASRRSLAIRRKGAPAAAIAALPAIRRGEEIVAVPGAGYASEASRDIGVRLDCVVAHRLRGHRHEQLSAGW